MHLRQLLHKIPLLGSLARKLRARFGGMPATPAAAPLEVPASEPPAAIPFADALRRFEVELGALFAPIKARPRYVSAGRSRKWRGHIPKLALSCADAMDRARLLFAGFDFDGGHLRELEREVHYVGLFLMFMRKATKELAALHANRKQELCDKTMQVVDQVRTVKDMPAAPAELSEEARQASPAIETLLRKSNQKVQQRRKHNAELRAQGEAQAAEARRELTAVELEKHVLRGGRLSAEAVEQAAGSSLCQWPAGTA